MTPLVGFLAALAAVAAAAALPAGEWPARPWSFLGLAPLGLGRSRNPWPS